MAAAAAAEYGELAALLRTELLAQASQPPP
jgi:hypothetical protein